MKSRLLVKNISTLLSATAIVLSAAQSFGAAKVIAYHDAARALAIPSEGVLIETMVPIAPPRPFFAEITERANSGVRLTPKEVISIAQKYGFVNYSNSADMSTSFQDLTGSKLVTAMQYWGFPKSASFIQQNMKAPENFKISAGTSRVFQDTQTLLCKPLNMTTSELKALFIRIDKASFDGYVAAADFEKLKNLRAECFGLDSWTHVTEIEIQTLVDVERGASSKRYELAETEITIRDHHRDHHGIPQYNIDFNYSTEWHPMPTSSAFPKYVVHSIEVKRTN